MVATTKVINSITGEVEPPKEMIVVTDVRAAVEKASNVIEAMQINSMAKAAEAFYAAQGMEENAQKAKAVSLWAQRRAGQFLEEMPKNKGTAGNGNPNWLGSTTMEPPRDDAPTLADLDIDKHESSRWQMLASIPEETFESYIDEKLAKGHEVTTGGLLKIAGHKAHVAFNSGENEWYTPPEYIEAAREVLGEIELDPASSKLANKTVKAKKFYTLDDDGLCQGWRGKVWMNPPYSLDLIGEFIAKYAEHVSSKDVTEGIVLVNNATETAWFSELVSVSSAVVFPKGRIKFIDKNGKPSGAPLQGQAIVYAGSNPDKFISVFSEFGWGAKL